MKDLLKVVPEPLQPPRPGAMAGPHHCRQFLISTLIYLNLLFAEPGPPLPTYPQSNPLPSAKGPAPAFLLQRLPSIGGLSTHPHQLRRGQDMKHGGRGAGHEKPDPGWSLCLRYLA